MPYSISEFMFNYQESGQIQNLLQGEIIQSHHKIHEDLQKSGAASLCVELVESLIHDEADTDGRNNAERDCQQQGHSGFSKDDGDDIRPEHTHDALREVDDEIRAKDNDDAERCQRIDCAGFKASQKKLEKSTQIASPHLMTFAAQV